MALTAEIVWFSNAEVCAFLSEFPFRQKVHWGGGGGIFDIRYINLYPKPCLISLVSNFSNALAKSIYTASI